MKNNILEIKNCILNDLDQLPEEGVIYEDLLNDIVIERYRDMFIEERFEYNIYISDTLVDCYVKILKNNEVTDPNVLINDMSLAQHINYLIQRKLNRPVSVKSFDNYYNKYQYTPVVHDNTKEVDEWLKENKDKYCKSNTLVMHLTDPSTTMLEQIYKGKGWDELHGREIPYAIRDEVINELIKAHERIVCLGHGTSGGLIGFINSSHSDALRDKKKFLLWCNADGYVKNYLNDTSGYFACGNMPSDSNEASWVGFHVSEEYMNENITYWCKLCADVVEECLEGNAKAGCKYIRDKYWEKYGKSEDPDEVGITLYNYKRTKTAGELLIDNPKDLDLESKYIQKAEGHRSY